MTILRLIEVSAASARAAIDTASANPSDGDAAVMRVGILEYVRLHASRIEAKGDDAELLKAYRAWLDTAVDVFSTGQEELIPDYLRSGALFAAELQLAQARANGALRSSVAA